jgi:hypothetical protein
MPSECAEKYVKAAEERDDLRLIVKDYEKLDLARLQQINTATTALAATQSLIPDPPAWYEAPSVMIAVGMVLGIVSITVATKVAQ